MKVAAWVLAGLAAIAGLYDSYLLVVEIAWADFHGGPAGGKELAISVAIALLAFGLPLALSRWLIRSGHLIGSGLVSIVAIAIYFWGFSVLVAAFTP